MYIKATTVWHKNTHLENCPRIAGMQPLYRPCDPISGSFEISSGNESVDACTRVWHSMKLISRRLQQNQILHKLNTQKHAKKTAQAHHWDQIPVGNPSLFNIHSCSQQEFKKKKKNENNSILRSEFWHVDLSGYGGSISEMCPKYTNLANPIQLKHLHCMIWIL